jgi:chromosome segregation protein
VAARKAERAANSEVAALRARVQALEETLRQGIDATAAVLADPGRFRGVLGPFAARLAVADGYETAIAAALGAAAEAVTVDGLESAVDVLTAIHAADAGTVGLVIAGPAANGEVKRPVLTGSARWAADLVTAPDELAGAVRELLAGVVVTADLPEAAAYVRDNPGFRAVTAAGDLLGAHWAHGGSARPQSLLDVRAAAGEAAARLTAAELTEEAAAEALAEASEAQEAARVALEETRGLMQAADAATAEISGRLGRLGGAARAGADEAKRLDASVGAARRSADKDAAKLAALKSELAEAEAEELRGPSPRDPDFENQLADDEREEMAQRTAAARDSEMEARLEVRTVEERLRAIGGRADSLAAAAAAERTARERTAVRRRQRTAQAAVARAVATGAGVAVEVAEASLAQADARRAAAEAVSAGSTETLKAVRARVTALAGELDGVVSTAHGAEIARAEHRLRLEQLAAHAVDEYGVEPEALIAEYGPDVPVPVTDAAPRPAKSHANGNGNGDGPPPATLADALRAVRAETGQPGEAAQLEIEAEPGSEPPAEVAGVPYVRAEQEARAEAAERQLARLGKVNPLALEEYTALQERHQFLATQLEDLRKTRRDLLTVVKEVDDRVQEVFASAYADTAREFEGLFARLFPGGSGRLLLTEPDDMLTTGIEIEARPPGKKVKRLSLLSGGERSLTAIAYLFAIFMARPSPFYVLDEVEAALDDTNLQRLLRVFGELRENSQLVVITHQRRTMEAADALYGVTMRGDGVSSVISQRFREHEPA